MTALWPSRLNNERINSALISLSSATRIDRPLLAGAAGVSMGSAGSIAVSPTRLGADTSGVASGGRDRKFEGRPHAGLPLERDVAAHPFDDAVTDGKAEPGAAIAARDAVVGLFELAENALLRLGRNADAGVAHQETDFIGPDAGLDDQCDAAGCGEFDGVAGEIEQPLPQPRRVADHFHRQAVVDIGSDFDLA